MKPILDIADIALVTQSHGERYAARMGQIGAALGANLLGCRLTEVPPGKRAWPFHNHHANEEMFVILAGDVVMCPSGGPETAHQLINTGAEDLRYLAISTMNAPDIGEYPDSAKFTALAGAAPGGDKTKRRFGFTGRVADGVDFWEGGVRAPTHWIFRKPTNGQPHLTFLCTFNPKESAGRSVGYRYWNALRINFSLGRWLGIG